jgi:CPA2 family monovalent cation:H+ antiporter-2
MDANGALVADLREKGLQVYLGDASRREFLERAGMHHARAFIVTLAGAEATERMVAEILKIRPKAQVLARARDANHASRLAALGAVDVIPETTEASLQLAGRLLEALDFPEDVATQRIADMRVQELKQFRRRPKRKRALAKAGE